MTTLSDMIRRALTSKDDHKLNEQTVEMRRSIDNRTIPLYQRVLEETDRLKHRVKELHS